MSEDLKELLHETADVRFATPDLGAITRRGDRVVRRRRAGLGALGAAAVVGVVALATGGGGLLGDESRDGPDLATSPLSVTGVTWVQDSELHVPGDTVDLDQDVLAYVRTAAGLALVDDQGVVRSPDASGEIREIGRTGSDAGRLVADADGALVGWVDQRAERPAFVVHDLRTGTEQRFDEHTTSGMGDLPDEEDPATFYALDGSTAYWRDARGAVAVDLTTGQARVLAANASGWTIRGAEDGLLARAVEGAGGQDLGTEVVTSDGQRTQLLEGAHGSTVLFSPDTRWASIEGDQPEVYDVTTGERVRIDIDGRFFGVGYEWIDEDTLAVFAARSENASTELLTCEVPAGTCTVAIDDLGTFAEIGGDFLLPVGEPMG